MKCGTEECVFCCSGKCTGEASAVVACLYYIFDKMFTDKKTTELTLF